jgi:hypothetical protein
VLFSAEVVRLNFASHSFSANINNVEFISSLFPEDPTSVWERGAYWSLPRATHLSHGCVGFKNETLSFIELENKEGEYPIRVQIRQTSVTSRVVTDEPSKNKVEYTAASSSKIFCSFYFRINIDNNVVRVNSIP